jgi:hypothetical protein
MFGVITPYIYTNRRDKKLDILVQIPYIVVMNLLYTLSYIKEAIIERAILSARQTPPLQQAPPLEDLN